MEVNSLFVIIKTKLPTRTLHHQEKKKTEYKFCYASGQNLPWFKLTFLLPGNGKDYENEFLQIKRRYTEIRATLPTPQKASGSILKNMSLVF